MFMWIAENIGTILVSIVLLAVVASVIAAMRKDRRNGKSACCGSCGRCPMHGACHAADAAKKAHSNG